MFLELDRRGGMLQPLDARRCFSFILLGARQSPSHKHAYQFVVPIWIQRRRGGGEKIRAQKKKNKEFLAHVKLAKITDFIATLRAYL